MKNTLSVFFILFIAIFHLQATPIKVVSFNILAPPWATPTSYPDSSAPYLDRNLRLIQILDVLNQLKGSTDVISLQEVSEPEYLQVKNALNGFVGIVAFHDPSYWSQYISNDPPWEPNGNALFFKSSKFKSISLSDVPLSNTGNHAAFGTAVIKGSNQPFRAIAVHFDSDTGANRKREMQAVLRLLTPQPETVDLIAGDFNSSPEQGNYSNIFQLGGFVDVLTAVGNTELTTPYTTQYSSSINFGRIDHIVVRNATPVDGGVLTFDMFTLFPDLPGNVNEEDRITENLRISGSDHFPIWGSIEP